MAGAGRGRAAGRRHQDCCAAGRGAGEARQNHVRQRAYANICERVSDEATGRLVDCYTLLRVFYHCAHFR